MKNVRHVGIVVKDLDRALYFYRDLLGLNVTQQATDESGDYIDNVLALREVQVTTVKLAADDLATRVELIRFHNQSVQTDRTLKTTSYGPTHVAFTVDDLDGIYRHLSAVGVRFNAPPQIAPGGFVKLTYCLDFEGNFVELVEELKTTTPKLAAAEG